ncbi:hypothetical protein DFJ58DRAFT_850688 [Suillus subalutaceus]|uniref:uncharacterized protein n=1 Tax=Suillus subalutaceus TaxID=48586 RepID=UPI001B874578|nr:uncharacterized protein DFJ58DRAFT_850688 [Suillus subalutaceus]KAG1813076.1 hypothetical protein DFJ58DRAFT_850688 [Suillus subalutaceus]
MQLAPGSTADQWFDESILSCSSFAHLHREFMLRWPPPKPPQYSRAQQKERVMAQTLKEEDIGVWLPGEPTGNYGQQFPQDVESVPAVKLKRAKEDLNMNRTRDANIAQLKAQNSSALNTIPFQFSHLSMDNGRPAQPYVRASHAYTNTIPFLTPPPNANPNAIISQGASMAPISRPVRGAGMNPMGWRGNPIMRTAFTRAQIMEKLNAVLQRQNTEAGVRQYEADVNTWHRMHGTKGVPSLERPYLLRPGTAIVGSVTEPTHLSSQCVTTKTLRPQESRWRQHVAAMLRRAVPGQITTPTYTIAHATQAVHPYYQQYGAPMTPPVFAVQEEQNWWEHSNVWAQQEAGYEWEPENYGGPLPTVEQ